MEENTIDEQRKLLDFMRIVGKLKHLRRTGWVKRGVPDPERVAGHMYRMSLLALVSSPGGGHQDHVDRTRCVKMALVHDLAEALVGDLTPHCGVSPAEKHARETAALRQISELVVPSAGAELRQLFEEYEAAETAEARFVHDLDKLDMVVQADEYEAQHGVELGEFFHSTQGVFRTETVRGLDAELRRQREQRRSGGEAAPASSSPSPPGADHQPDSGES